MTLSRRIQSSLVLIALVSAGSACTRQNWRDTPIRIEPVKPLTAAVGQDVNWSFRAWRGNRELKIINITARLLPVGVMPIRDPKNPSLTGKVVSRQVRQSVIRVVAFDKESCVDEFEVMKKTAVKNAIDAGKKDVAIPISPCDLTSGGTSLEAQAHTGQALFMWHLVDGPDAVQPSDYASFVASSLKSAPRPEVKKSPHTLPAFIGVPNAEVPHTLDPVVGACAKLDRKQCGKDAVCLWGRVSCISKETTGHVAIREASKS